MPVTLSNGTVLAIVIFAVSGGVAAGIFHDQSIKAVYSTFGSKVADLQNQTKFTFVHGKVSTTSGTPVDIFFDGPGGPALSSAVVANTTGFLYQYDYQIFLKSGTTYGVRVNYEGTFSQTHSCAGIPVVFTPSGADYAQNFQC